MFLREGVFNIIITYAHQHRSFASENDKIKERQAKGDNPNEFKKHMLKKLSISHYITWSLPHP